MRPENDLTFAEAMALDPSEVEYKASGGDWLPLAHGERFPLNHLRLCRFRRARPKRSRVQEMAERMGSKVIGQGYGTPSEWQDTAYHSGLYDAIRAVCEWLRGLGLGALTIPSVAAETIEREFLEPR